jgi:hypothetical protein
MAWHEFNASNQEGTCLWCGRRLRTYMLDRQPQDAKAARHDQLFNTTEGGRKLIAQIDAVRQRDNPRKGDYGDGFFCGLRCAYQFAVRFAQLKRRLTVPGVKGL